MERDKVLQQLCSIAAGHFQVAAEILSSASGPEQVGGWDSLSHVAFVAELEAGFGVSFEIDEVMEMENLGAIATILSRKLDFTAL